MRTQQTISVYHGSSGIQDDYLKLIKRFPLAPIKDQDHLKEAFKIIDELAIIDEHKLTRGQADYLSVLSDLIERYEDANYPDEFFFKSGKEALEFLVNESGMTASDLGRLLGNRQLGAALLRGDRELSKAHITKLCDHFKVSADLFLLPQFSRLTTHNHPRRPRR